MTHQNSNKPMLRADSVSFSLNNRSILSKLHISINAGELVGLIGPNGAGKSTLLRLLAGLNTVDSGTIKLDGLPLRSLSIRARARQIGWLEQLGTVHWPISVERLVSLGRLPHLTAWQRPGKPDYKAINQALIDTDCMDLRHRNSMTLSGGEQARVLLARALAAEPRILLADEPVSALDLGHQLQTMDVLRRFACDDRACVVVLHDLSLAARYCDRLYLLNHGNLIAHGSVSTVLSNSNIRQVYGVDVISGCDQVPWIVPLCRVQS